MKATPPEKNDDSNAKATNGSQASAASSNRVRMSATGCSSLSDLTGSFVERDDLEKTLNLPTGRLVGCQADPRPRSARQFQHADNA